jgi:hypothetical protein
LRGEMQIQRDVVCEVANEAIEKVADKILDEVERRIRDVESKLFTTVDRRFGELMGRIDGLLDSRRSFKRFANETTADVADLPNWRKTTH